MALLTAHCTWIANTTLSAEWFRLYVISVVLGVGSLVLKSMSLIPAALLVHFVGLQTAVAIIVVAVVVRGQDGQERGLSSAWGSEGVTAAGR